MITICVQAPSRKEWNAKMNALKTRQFTTLTAEEILAMDDMECKLLMLHNEQFYALAIEALGQYVDMFLAQTNEFIREEWEGDDAAPQFDSLDELLYGSDYFGNEREGNRREFVRVFLDNLWDYAELQSSQFD